jgi:hypothetical protein
MSVDWNLTGDTVAVIVLAISTFYLADRLVIWLVTRWRRRADVKRGK